MWNNVFCVEIYQHGKWAIFMVPRYVDSQMMKHLWEISWCAFVCHNLCGKPV